MLYDLIIIGGGTAGLSAALYALRGGLKTLLLEKMVHGGQIVSSPLVENYPALPEITGAEYAQRLLEQVNSLGLELRYEAVDGVRLMGEVKEVQTAADAYQGRTLIWAAGVVPRRLGLADEERFIGRGVSFCATCDGALYKGKEVAVIGGGNTALEEALFLSKICAKVHLIHRRERFSAEAMYVQRALGTDNIQVHFKAQVEEYVGKNRLETIKIQEAETRKELSVAAVFLAIGKIPENGLLAGELSLDKEGYVRAGEDCLTDLPGVYVAGDCRTKPLRQLVTAAADGAVAASQAIAFLRQQEV